MNLQYLLIDSHFEETKEESFGHGRFIPYGLSILDNALKAAGYHGRLILDAQEYKLFMNTADPTLENIKLVGIGSSTITRFDAKAKIEECRRRFPNSSIVAGGPHFGNCAEDALANIPELDIVVRGEGDEAIVELMRHACGEIDITMITGISYRGSDGRILSPGAKRIVMDLPDLRFMEKFFSMEQFKQNPLHETVPIPAMNILAGRGCPYGCIFCSVNRTKNRMYPVKDVVDIIEETTRKYGIRGVKFFDDALTLDTKSIQTLCGELLRRNLDILWWCDSRANIDLELLPLMYSAGCRYISVGLETDSPKIQKVIGKKITNDQVVSFTKKCQEVGISVYVFLMTGLPDETPEDLDLTIDIARYLCKNHKAIAGGVGATVILPGTQLEKIARERGILPMDFSWHKPFHNPRNVEYDVSPRMPLYLEGISAEAYQEAKRRMLANYADSLDFKTFMYNAVEQLLRKDISWSEKLITGNRVLGTKVKSLLSFGDQESQP